MKKSTSLTPGEFELMEILWPLGEASVRAVWSRVRPERGLAYTTVMTVLEKMHRKGILAQNKKGKAYFYSPLLSREQAIKGIVEHVCEVYFGGSHSEMIGFISQHCSPATLPQEAPKPPASGEIQADAPPNKPA
jgi:predicted transcriptional regulator